MSSKNKRECSAQQRRFLDALGARSEAMESLERINRELRELDVHRDTLLDVLRMQSSRAAAGDSRQMHSQTFRPCEVVRDSPLHIKGERYPLAVFSLGRIPTPSMRPFYNNKYIYPIDYMCKRVYYRHRLSGENVTDLALYRCTIRNVQCKPMFEIVQDGDLCIRGRASDVFSTFKGLFPVNNIDFANLQDFFGLNNPEIKRLLVELSGFRNLDRNQEG